MILQQILKLSRVSGWIWNVPDHLRSEAEQTHDDWLAIVSFSVKNRHHEKKIIREKIRAWIGSPDMHNISRECRNRYLFAKLRKATIKFKWNKDRYIRYRQMGILDDSLGIFIDSANNLSKQMSGYELALGINCGKVESKNIITDEMIDLARDFPIESLVEVNKMGRAKCCFHAAAEDYNMDIRQNFAFCYVCGKSSDVIGVYMALNPGIKFRDAVIKLNNK